jgi:hypothetical protein
VINLIGYEIDYSDVQIFVNRLGWESAAATALFFKEAKEELKNIIVETIMTVAPSAGPGFPEIYQDHLISAVYNNPPIRDNGPAGLEVDFNMLGTYDDFRLGFHRHAISSDNKRIELPYTGQDLKNDDVEVRRTFWEDTVAPTYLYEATLYNRVEVWGPLMAPEWWVLQNGSETEPYVTPTPLGEVIAGIATPRLYALYEEAEQKAVNLSDHGWNVTPTGGLRHAERGGYVGNIGQYSPHTL